MNSLTHEIENVQNPAIGAAILWRFVCGYYSTEKNPVPFPLLFIVLPMIFREDLCDIIKTTQKGKGLSKVSEKLFKDKKNDNLYAINNTAISLRQKSLESICIAENAKLLVLDVETALVYPLIETKKTTVSSSTKALLDAADKLGLWCSSLSLLEICDWLKVRF